MRNWTNKTRVFSLGMLAALIVIFTGCSGASKNSAPREGQIQVAATIFPVASLVESVGGKHVDVVQVIPPGASPHFFEPTPSLIRELQSSEALFRIGSGYDNWTDELTESLPNMKKVSLDSVVSLKTGVIHHHDDHEDEHGHDDHEEDEHEDEEGIDPHYWLDPENAIEMVEHIAKELAEIDPENSAEFRQNAQVFKAEIEAKHAEWNSAVQNIEQKELITFHDAFAYFADHFGLTVVATFEPFAGKEPTPQYLADLQTELDEYGVTTMYLEPQMPKDVIEQFAKDNGLTVGILDPIGGVAGRNSYIELIDYNIQNIAEQQ